jgi:hypothetical protein
MILHIETCVESCTLLQGLTGGLAMLRGSGGGIRTRDNTIMSRVL